MRSNIASAECGTRTERRTSMAGPRRRKNWLRAPAARQRTLGRRARRRRRRLRFLGLLVRDAGVAVDAGGLARGELLVLLDRVFRLLRGGHRRRVVAGAAVPRVVFAHLVPD